MDRLKGKYKRSIISGAVDVFVELVAKKLGVTDYYAPTKFIFDNNEIPSDFKYILNRGDQIYLYLKK